jgi:predicted NBD/HSP70 family sugar kinase
MTSVQGRTDVTRFAALADHGASARAVIRELLVHGPMARAELARRLQLSPAALTRVTRELLETRTIREADAAAAGTGGRPGTPLEVDVDRHQMVGVKVTADGVYAVRTDALGRVLQGGQRRLDATGIDHIAEAIVDLVNEVAEGHPVEGLGVGLAGAMSRFDDRARHNVFLGWDDVPFGDMLESACGLPTVISNDVRALTAGVHWSGPARGRDDFAVVTTGVGIGLGLVIDGRVVVGPRGRAGMIGHQRVSDSGPLCVDGHRGCASSYLTTAAITRDVAVAHGDPRMTLDRVCTLADDGDPAARRTLADAGRTLGLIVAGLVNTLDLPIVILAGDGLPAVIRAQPELERSLAEHLDRHAAMPDLRFLVSDFDEWARGAAVVACQWLLLEPPWRRLPEGSPRRTARERPWRRPRSPLGSHT